MDHPEDAFASGCEVKVAISGLCRDMFADDQNVISHEVFVQCGSCYYYTERRQFMSASQPVVRVKPSIPMRYERKYSKHATRWFVR